MPTGSKASPSILNTCVVCQSPASDWCSQCKIPAYCGRKCQKVQSFLSVPRLTVRCQVHWKQGHRNECGLLTRAVEDKSMLREKECPICLCDWEESDVQPVQLPCSHTVCCHCLQELRDSNIRHACPLCRAALPSDGYKLYADAMTLCIRAAAGTNDKFKQRLWYRTAELLEASIAQGFHYPLLQLSRLYQDGTGVTQDIIRAVALLNQATLHEQTAGPAMNNLGVLYFNGEHVPQDQVRAAELYTQAVDAFKVAAGGPVLKCPDFAQAYENLAVCYNFGCGVSADILKAQELNEAAIACGSSTAGDSLAHQLYEDGPFQDRARAVQLWQECFENGQIDAAFDIGLCYSDGEGVDQDDTRAAYYYEIAADDGHGQAQCNLGVLYEHGYGVTQDLKVAFQLYTKAAEQGIEIAQHNLEHLRTHENGNHKRRNCNRK